MGIESLSAALPIAAAAGTSYVLIGRFCRPGSRFHWLDQPNERSLHERPTPRTGGLGIMAGVAVGWAMAEAPMAIAFVPALVLAAVSVWDDARGLPVAVRLVSHLAAATAFTVASGCGYWLAVIVVLATVWMANLFNFMDGSDGLAGGMAAVGFGCYALAANLGGATALALLSWLLVVAALAFLAFNFAPARIFMGDAGSIPLGFLAASLGFSGSQTGAWPAWFPVLVFSPFIADATVTLGRRALRGERIWRAHREHAYQKLVRMGWSHRRLAMYAYGLMLAAGATALALLGTSTAGQWLGLAVWAVAYGLLFAVVEWRWRLSGGASS